MLRKAALVLLIAGLPLAACAKKPPAPVEPPKPTLPDTAGQGAARERARQDSIAAAERARAEAAAREATARATAVLQEMVFFDYDVSELRQDAQEALGRKVPILRANAGITLRVTGHADERGSLEYNLALGMRRAQSVKDYLAGFGIDGARIQIDSMGEDQPLDEGHDEAAWAKNRRAEFGITGGGNAITLPGS
ncbi:MAG: peptidoglycan-associated lipoprotein [Gemmatimonadetes bacterium]|nr:peptidoglycan-associated lipoprotein [Gemmatimonadota bacterium]